MKAYDERKELAEVEEPIYQYLKGEKDEMRGEGKSEKTRAEELAKKLGTAIPKGISIHFAWLPLLEAIVAKVESLEGEKR